MKNYLSAIVVSFCITAVAPAQIPTDALEGYFPMNGSAADESTNSNDGTVVGATLTEDRFGNPNSAYLFNGISDFIRIPNDFDFQERTFSVWYYAESVSDVQSGRVCVSDNPGLEYGSTNFNVINGQDNCSYNILIDAGGSVTDNHFDTIVLRKWYHAAITVDAEHLIGYLNGLPISDIEMIPHSSDQGFENTYLGVDRNEIQRFFDGKIDDLRIYSRVLEPCEILALYAEGNCSLPVTTDTVTVYDTVTVTQNITVTDTLIVDVDIATGAGPEDIRTFRFYPNPTNDILNINVSDIQGLSSYRITIVSVLGQTVFDEEIVTSEFQISMDEFMSTGSYFIRVHDAVGNILDERHLILQ